MAATSARSYRSSRPYQRARAEMFKLYGDVCHLCGHSGATDADHLIPLAHDLTQPPDPHGMRPAHGVAGCVTCGRKCNQERGTGAVRRTLRHSRPW